MAFKWPFTKEKRSAETISTIGLMLGQDGTFINPETASRHAVVHRCVQLISESLSFVPCRLYRITGDDGREPATDHPLHAVLQDQFNPMTTAFEGREAQIAATLIQGNGYAKKEFNAQGQVIGLYPMHPSAMTVERLNNGRLRYKWNRPDGRTEILLQDEVLHTRYRSKDGIMGISPIQHAGQHMSLAMAQVKTAKDQAESGFKGAGALTIDKVLTDAQRAAVKQNFAETLNRGTAREIMVLEAGMQWLPFSFPNSDAEFLESRKLSNLDLCRIYGVPPSAVGITDDATYSNIGEESRALVQRCLAPMAARIEQAMNASLLTPEERKTMFIEHDLAGLLRGDLASRYSAYQVARQAGFMSVNEIRKFENMPKIEGGDEYLSPLNMTPSNSPIEGRSMSAHESRVDIPSTVVNVPPTVVNISPPVVNVNPELKMPPRKIESKVFYNKEGNITGTTQLETDA
jgi:HK97 family phage portal protein